MADLEDIKKLSQRSDILASLTGKTETTPRRVSWREILQKIESGEITPTEAMLKAMPPDIWVEFQKKQPGILEKLSGAPTETSATIPDYLRLSTPPQDVLTSLIRPTDLGMPPGQYPTPIEELLTGKRTMPTEITPEMKEVGREVKLPPTKKEEKRKQLKSDILKGLLGLIGGYAIEKSYPGAVPTAMSTYLERKQRTAEAMQKRLQELTDIRLKGQYQLVGDLIQQRQTLDTQIARLRAEGYPPNSPLIKDLQTKIDAITNYINDILGGFGIIPTGVPTEGVPTKGVPTEGVPTERITPPPEVKPEEGINAIMNVAREKGITDPKVLMEVAGFTDKERWGKIFAGKIKPTSKEISSAILKIRNIPVEYFTPKMQREIRKDIESEEWEKKKFGLEVKKFINTNEYQQQKLALDKLQLQMTLMNREMKISPQEKAIIDYHLGNIKDNEKEINRLKGENRKISARLDLTDDEKTLQISSINTQIQRLQDANETSKNELAKKGIIITPKPPTKKPTPTKKSRTYEDILGVK
jgi:hypothetical protein